MDRSQVYHCITSGDRRVTIAEYAALKTNNPHLPATCPMCGEELQLATPSTTQRFIHITTNPRPCFRDNRASETHHRIQQACLIHLEREYETVRLEANVGKNHYDLLAINPGRDALAVEVHQSAPIKQRLGRKVATANRHGIDLIVVFSESSSYINWYRHTHGAPSQYDPLEGLTLGHVHKAPTQHSPTSRPTLQSD